MNILERLVTQNPWWETGRVDAVAGMQKRNAFSLIKGHMEAKQIISITGLRRVGKTVLSRQLIADLLSSGTDARRVLYFSFDELLAKDPAIIEDVLKTYGDLILKAELRGVYVFFDEINHIPDWQVVLKRFYDLESGIKFVVTGSSGVRIRKSAESLAGRIFEFEMEPLSFREFLRLRKIEISYSLDTHVNTAQKELTRYLTAGGFPELVDDVSFEKAKLYVGSIADKIILSDIPQAGDVGNPEILREVFRLLAASPGSLVEYKNLASSLKVSYQTVSKYVGFLESAHLIRTLLNKRGSPVAMSRKAKKIYLAATPLALFSADSEQQVLSILPMLAENAVALHIGAKYFWRDYYELDFVTEKGAVEVKYAEHANAEKNIAAAVKRKEKRLVVVTKNEERKENRAGMEAEYVPLWKFLLTDF